MYTVCGQPQPHQTRPAKLVTSITEKNVANVKQANNGVSVG
jgi:hypothetical protein